MGRNVGKKLSFMPKNAYFCNTNTGCPVTCKTQLRFWSYEKNTSLSGMHGIVDAMVSLTFSKSTGIGAECTRIQEVLDDRVGIA